MTTQKELRRLAKDLREDVANYEDESAAANALLAHAVSGVDLASIEDTVVRALDEATQLGILRPLAEALVRHYCQQGSPGKVLGLFDKVQWAYFISDAVNELAETGFDVSGLVEAAAARKKGLHRDFDFARLLRAHRGGPGPALAAARSNPMAVVDMLKDGMLFGKFDPEPHLPALAEVLRTSKTERVRSGAAWAAHVAAEKDADLTVLVPELRAAITDRHEDVRRPAAYALAHFSARVANWAQFDELLGTEDPVVRYSAIRSLCVHIHHRLRPDPPLLRRFLRGLLDADDTVRELARSCLLDGFGQGLIRDPLEAEALDELFGAFDREPVAAGIIAVLEGAARANAQTKDALLSRLERQGGARGLVRGLLDALHANELLVCDVCVKLPRSEVWWYESDLPDEIAQLRKEGPWLTCPTCQNVYSMSHTQEWDDFVLDEEWSFSRLSPPEIVRHVETETGNWWRENLDHQLDVLRMRVRHPRVEVRVQAARALAEHAMKAAQWDTLAELVSGEDVPVRTEVSEAMLQGERSGLAEVPNKVREAIARLAAVDKNPAAAVSRLRDALRRREHDVVRELLAESEVPLLRAVIDELTSHAEEGKEVKPFADAVVAHLDAPDTELRLAVRRFMNFSGAVPADARLSRAVAMLESDDPDVRGDGAGALADLARSGADVASTVPRLVELLEDRESVWHANEALKVFAGASIDVTPMLEIVFRHLGDPQWSDLVSFDETLSDLHHSGFDVTPALPQLARLLWDGDGNERWIALELLRDMQEKGVDFGPIVDEIAANLGRMDDNLDEISSQWVARYWAQRAEWDRLRELLKSTRQNVVWGACEALAAVSRDHDLTPILPAVAALTDRPGKYLRDHVASTVAALEQPPVSPAARKVAATGKVVCPGCRRHFRDIEAHLSRNTKCPEALNYQHKDDPPPKWGRGSPCPECGSSNYTWEFLAAPDGAPFAFTKCGSCGHSDCFDEYDMMFLDADSEA